ncbi:MAG TPA: hypothetical protein VKB46_12395 [Pyrinomonadaceae bacterium]|nr:hypothetical protein [Pyrinomonadaceae bacterium]
MPTRKTAQIEKPTFIFKGTVKKLKSATMKEVPVDKNTAIVTVDQVIEAPADLANYDGQDLTVQLSGSHKVGETLILNTVSWLYGESIAVRSLSEEPIKASHSAVLAAGVDPAARRRQREQREHFDEADLVVSGKVISVRLPGDEQSLVKGAVAASGARHKPVSEHDPKWREAVVEVDDVHKGDHKKKQVVIRFPASNDVMWYNAPKFHPGQQGHFMLTRTKPDKPTKTKKVGQKAAAEVAGATPTDTYVALDPLDFQPYSEPGGIKTIIDAKSS